VVKWFFDTSVLIPVFLEDHEHHQPSLAAFLAAKEEQGCCAAHSLAELYSALTRMPGKHRLSGEQVLLFLEAIEERLTVVALDGEDYDAAIKQAAAAGMVGGMLCDALTAQCALKARAEKIYAWNVEDFQRLGAEVARRVQQPRDVS
jgi:predicted nucleic acid-binding protein